MSGPFCYGEDNMTALFDEMTIGSMTARNRLFRAATYEHAAARDGSVTPKLVEEYRSLAEGGVGTIITSFAYVRDDEYRYGSMLSLCRDELIDGYRELVDVAHASGAKIVMQLVYCGVGAAGEGKREPALAPSDIYGEDGHMIGREMSEEDRASLARDFADCARRAKEAGFDGVEVHAAHGYLLAQYLSPLFNHREDEYGGTIENRCRYVIEVVEAVRAAVGDAYPVMIKINSRDGKEGGLEERESLEAAEAIAPYVDAIEVSGGDFGRIRTIGKNACHGFYAEYAARLAELVDIPVVLTGGNRIVREMQGLLDTTAIAGFGVARPLVSEPDLPARWKADADVASRCVGCGKCFKSADAPCFLDRSRA